MMVQEYMIVLMVNANTFKSEGVHILNKG